MKETLIVNLFGSPGSGKSTGAAYIFSQLKLKGIDCELVTEFAKDKVWENNEEVFKNQAYIFGKQYFKISRVYGKVDVLITDSPLLLSSFYNNSKILGEEFDTVVKNVSDNYNNLFFFIERVKDYNLNGRFQSKEESDIISEKIKHMISSYSSTIIVSGDIEGYNKIINKIIEYINGSKSN